MIHEIRHGDETTFVISADDVWLPGSYESRQAAEYAFLFCDCHKQAMQIAANEETSNHVITLERMRVFKEKHGFKCGKGAHAK